MDNFFPSFVVVDVVVHATNGPMIREYAQCTLFMWNNIIKENAQIDT